MNQNLNNLSAAAQHQHTSAPGAHSHTFSGIGGAESAAVGMMDVKLPENHGGFYIQYRVNGQKFWRWKNARAMAVAIEALDLEPVIEVRGFSPIDGWETIWCKGVSILGVDWAAASGAMGHSHGLGVANPGPMTATELAIKSQEAHTRAMADFEKILRNPPQK